MQSLMSDEELADYPWTAFAGCHGLWHVFDLLSSSDEPDLTPNRVKMLNRERVGFAGAVCGECPVFDKCLQATIKERPVGVIRCGVAIWDQHQMSNSWLYNIYQAIDATVQLEQAA